MIVENLVKDVYLPIKNVALKVGDWLTQSEQKFGEDLGKTFYYGLGGEKEINKINADTLVSGSQLMLQAKKATNPERKQKLLQEAADAFKASGATTEDIIGQIKSNRQYLGDAAGTLIDILAFGSYGKATAGMKSFQSGKALPSAVSGIGKGAGFVKGAIQGAKTLAPATAAIGGAGGVAGAMQENASLGETAASGVIGAGVGGIFGTVVGGLTGGVAGEVAKFKNAPKGIYSPQEIAEAEEYLAKFKQTQMADERMIQGIANKAEVLSPSSANKIFRQSITETIPAYGNEPNIIINGKVNPDLITGRVNDIVEKLQDEGKNVLANTFKTQMEGKVFNNLTEMSSTFKGLLDKFIGKTGGISSATTALAAIPLGSLTKEGATLATRLLQKLPNAGKVSKEFIENLANNPELKQVEKDIVRSVMDTFGNVKKIDIPLFINKVIKELEPDLPKTLRGTKGMTAEDIMKTYPDIQLKRDVPATDIYGNKVNIAEGEALTPYEMKGNKILLQDGETYVVSKSQFQNIKGQSVSREVKEFAPELKGTEETVKEGSSVERDGFIPSTKYSSYQLPDGKNYKEILIKAPETSKAEIKKVNDFYQAFVDGKPTGTLFDTKQQALDSLGYSKSTAGVTFKSSHWDEPNVLSHLRMNERTYQGKKVAFMEELQSDFSREFRKQQTGNLAIIDSKWEGLLKKMTDDEILKVVC